MSFFVVYLVASYVSFANTLSFLNINFLNFFQTAVFSSKSLKKKLCRVFPGALGYRLRAPLDQILHKDAVALRRLELARTRVAEKQAREVRELKPLGVGDAAGLGVGYARDRERCDERQAGGDERSRGGLDLGGVEIELFNIEAVVDHAIDLQCERVEEKAA